MLPLDIVDASSEKTLDSQINIGKDSRTVNYNNLLFEIYCFDLILIVDQKVCLYLFFSLNSVNDKYNHSTFKFTLIF